MLKAVAAGCILVASTDISFDLDAVSSLRTVHVRFSGLHKTAQYRIIWNGNQSDLIGGDRLMRDGFTIQRF